MYYRPKRNLNQKSQKNSFLAVIEIGLTIVGDIVSEAGRPVFQEAGLAAPVTIETSNGSASAEDWTMSGPIGSEDGAEDEVVQLLRKHQNQLFGYIFSMVRNFSDAEDVLQQTLLTLWGKLDEFTPGTSFMAWAKAVARNKTLTFLRTQRRQRVRFSDDVLDRLADCELWTPQALDDRLAALANCRKKLSPVDQSLLAQCYSTASSIRCVAEQLERPVDSVYSSLSRIRRALYECIERSLAMEHRT